MPRRVLLALVVFASFTWTASLVAAPALASFPGAAGPALSALTYAAGSLVCHQMPERSFHLGAAQLPVCARCLGLYLGGLLGALGWAAWGQRRHGARSGTSATLRHLRPVLLMAAAPTLLTVGTGWLGVWDPLNEIRFALALPLGAATGLLVAAVAAGDLE